MALSDFIVNPMTGSGSNFATEVVVAPINAKTSAGDLQANLSVNAGGSGHPLTLIQYGIPITRRINGNANIASGGGVATYVVETHYDYYFEGIPDWITLSDKAGNISLNDGQTGKIIAAMATGNEYYFNVAANPSAQTRTTGHDVCNFRNYRRDDSIDRNYHTTITITQDAGVPDAPIINATPTTIVFDWDAYTSGNTTTINITANVGWTASCDTNDFVIVGSTTGNGDGSIVVRPAEDNVLSTNKTGTITITNGEVSATISLTQYKEPYEELQGSTEVNPTGGTKYMTIKSDYAFWYKAGSSLGGTNGYSTEYITMMYNGAAVQPAPVSEATAQPAQPTGTTYEFVWLYNDAAAKNDLFIVQYRGVDGVIREMRKNFSVIHQDYIPQVEDYVIASPSAMTIDWWITSATNFTIETYSGEWSYDVQGDTNDFNFEKIGSQLKVSPKTQNSTNAKRNLSFSFSAGTSTATTTATATQLRNPVLSYNSGVFTIPSGGTDIEFSVVSDYSWWIIDGFPTDYVGYTPQVNDGDNPNSATTGTTFDAVFPVNNTGEQIPANTTAYFDLWYYDRSGALRTDEYSHRISGFKQSAGNDELYATANHSFADISSGGTNGQYYLTIYATAPWGITCPEWVSFSPSTGAAEETTIAYLSVEANDDEWRAGQIVVSAGTATPVRINISQNAAYVPPEVGYVSIRPTTLSVGSGTSYGNSFEVSANTAWTITSPEWVIWSTSPSGSIPITGGTGNKTIYAVVEENSSAAQRVGTAVFSSATNTINVVITQDEGVEEEYLIIKVSGTESNQLNINSGAVSIANFVVSASTDWEITDKPAWYSLNVSTLDESGFITSGTSGSTRVYVHCLANPYTEVRSGTTTITNGSITKTINVIQAAAASGEEEESILTLDPASITTATQTAFIDPVEVYNDSSEDYYINYDGDWAMFYDGANPSTAQEIDMIEAGFADTIFLSVQATSERRTMTITFTGDNSGNVVEFVITQG